MLDDGAKTRMLDDGTNKRQRDRGNKTRKLDDGTNNANGTQTHKPDDGINTRKLDDSTEKRQLDNVTTTRKLDDGIKTCILEDGTKSHRGGMDNTAERGGWTDLSPPRAHMKGTGPSSRPPCRWLRRDSRPEPRALHGATVQKSVTGDQQEASRNSFFQQ